MIMKGKKSPQNTLKKRKGPNFFLLLLFFFCLSLFLQSLFSKEKGNVAFVYQVEHLVNLELITPSESKKIVRSDQLATFSGLFRSEVTEDGKRKYQYLQKLAEYHRLKEQREQITEQLTLLRKEVLQAGEWFLKISGLSPPSEAYSVVDWSQDNALGVNHIFIRTNSEENPLVSFREIKEDLSLFEQREFLSLEEWYLFQKKVDDLIHYFLSPILRITDQEVKRGLQEIASSVKQWKVRDKKEENFAFFKFQLDRVRSFIEKLDREHEGTRLNQTRSVQRYKRQLSKSQEIANQIEHTYTLVKRFYQDRDVWFFRNQELSSRLLEKQEKESFTQWFAEASVEWENFHYNRSSHFSVLNQPLTLVLEKKFRTEEPSTNYWNYLLTPLPIILFILFLYFLFAKQIKNVGEGPMGFGRSPARMITKEENKIRFRNVAGIDEAKEELREIVAFLKDPQKFTSLGARIPKGVLCVGPPGTGKTLLAKAVAGEAECPFFFISGSDFVEMFVGVGASRVRNLFSQAKKNTPCIIFIDEIDAVGRNRGAGLGGGNDEREQTLNQLLVEMDGFDSKKGIILMAATNRPDVLDKALLRPGRFDRKVYIPLPDLRGRYEIITILAEKVIVNKQADLLHLARKTQGCSGADLENILNEAALLAVRREKKEISQEELSEASDKVRFGKERKSLGITDEDKRKIAYHEAGHAILGLVLKDVAPLEKITIIPRELSLGSTHFLPQKEIFNRSKTELENEIVVCMGGRCAEKIFLGEEQISTGARGDFIQATNIAHSMVCEYGMGKKVGVRCFLQSGNGEDLHLSDELKRQVDEEIQSILAESIQKAEHVLQSHKKQIEEMKDALLQFETLNKEDADKIMSSTWDSKEKERQLMIDQESLGEKRPSSKDKKKTNLLPSSAQLPT